MRTHLCAEVVEVQHGTCPGSHVDIPSRCAQHFDEVTSACKSCRKYSMTSARVNRWTSTSLKKHYPDVVRVFQKKTANQLEVWRGEVDTPGPPISMLCDSSAWRSLQKTAILAPAIEKRWLATLRQGVRGLPVDVETFWSMAVFLKNPAVLLCTTRLAQSNYFPTTLYYKPCTRDFPVLRCATVLAQSTSQYYFVLQSLHKALPSTTLYYKACTKYSPVLLCTTKLAQSTSQYYFVLQSLRKVIPSTTLYCKTCTKYFPVLLCTTKLAQNTSEYYFVLQSLRKGLPSTTLYYKACTKYFPVLPCTTKLAQNTSQYILLCTTKLAHKQAFTQRSFYTEKLPGT